MLNFIWRHTLCRLGLHRVHAGSWQGANPEHDGWNGWYRRCPACGYTQKEEW